MQGRLCSGAEKNTAGTPWLKINDNYKEINVEAQEADENSVLSYYRKLTALRKDPALKDAFIYGEFVPALEDVPGVLAFYRRGAQENVLVLTNFGTKETEVSLDKEPDHILLSNQGRTGKIGRKAVLRPCEALVLKMK